MIVIKNQTNNMYLVGVSTICKDELQFSTDIDDSLFFTKEEYAECYIENIKSFIGRKLDLSIVEVDRGGK